MPGPVCAPGYEDVSSSMPQYLAVGRGKNCGSSPSTEFNRRKIFAQANPRYFDPHWSEDAVRGALQNGRAFKAVLRVNAYNRLEAYCTLDGVPVDILINGVSAQNRSVEGDVVAVILNPTSAWVRLKSSSAQLATSDSSVKCNTVNGENSPNGDKFLCEEHDCTEDPVSDSEAVESLRSLKRLSAMVSSFPSRRPTGRIVAIIEPSRRREAVVGFLSIKKPSPNFHNKTVQLIPTDSRFPEMLIEAASLPDYLKEKVLNDEEDIKKELLAAKITTWSESSLLPRAQVMHIFGKGGEIKPQIGAILFENAICCADFSSESLSCLPKLPWSIPKEEFSKRKDLREVCTFTIDPSSAVDLDDALSFEKVGADAYQVGVHIADASYFVTPDTALDTEAQVRSTSVYILQHKLPMLPPLLSSELVSLLPHEDKLTVSIIWLIDLSGNVLSQWIGRSIIRSSRKLSYEDAQRIIDGFDVITSPITEAVKTLHQISENLKEKRLKDGALLLENAKIEVLFDENGNPYDWVTRQQKESNFLVREFMLLANNTAAKTISRYFPESALLRRHPEPNLRKLGEFKAFCSKHGFELDTSSSGHFYLSLEKIRERLKDDKILFEILISYALRPMQLAAYFSTGDYRNKKDEWGHYALGVPQYTHFTSPLRRYPDIVVHRMLLAALEAEDFYLKKGNAELTDGFLENGEFREFLVSAAEKYGVPCAKDLSEIASHCNERKLASRQAEEAGKKVYVWALLKKKEMLVSEARVIRLGPKFMSIYIHKLAIERRISYADVEGLEVEWLENTSTLVLHLYTGRRAQRRPNPLKEVALVEYPTESTGVDREAKEREILPLSLPLTLQPLSTIPVVLHAIGGEGKSPEIGLRLYLSSYFAV
ncbi:ribonuclease II/R family protein [Wolffia australiana]